MKRRHLPRLAGYWLAAILAMGAPVHADTPTPKEAGARYGQALGALEVCYGSKLTAKAEALPAAYSGSELESFKAEAAKIYDAWLEVRACARQSDPNQCKIIMDKSCLGAEAEIGAEGKAMPGLVEFLKRGG